MSSADKWLPPLESGGGLALIGLVARLYKRWRHRARFGRIEDERLVTDLVNKAVATQGAVLEDLRRERVDDRQHIDRLSGELTSRDKIIRELRKHVSSLERRVGALERENRELGGEEFNGQRP